METLPYLHQNKEIFLNSKAKWVQGFSDVSLLNFYLTTNYNFATIHANSFSSYAMIPWDKSLETPVDFVMNFTDELIQTNFKFYEASSHIFSLCSYLKKNVHNTVTNFLSFMSFASPIYLQIYGSLTFIV